MKNDFVQKFLDKLIDKTILWLIPETATPNQFTYFRIASVPFIFILLDKNELHWAFALFLISASTDFIDGAMARTRDQITDLGKILDPIADKMLILTVLVYIGFEYWIVKAFVVVILFEVVGTLSQALFAKYLGRPIPANVFGKIKMVLQTVCVIMFLIGIISSYDPMVVWSEYLLFGALFFAIISAAEQMRRAAVRQLRREHVLV